MESLRVGNRVKKKKELPQNVVFCGSSFVYASSNMR